MAREGACFVLVATQVLSEENHAMARTANSPFFKGVEGTKGQKLGAGGFAMIFGPDARALCEALEKSEEGVVTAEVELSMIGCVK